jgi:hypothetical protein
LHHVQVAKAWHAMSASIHALVSVDEMRTLTEGLHLVARSVVEHYPLALRASAPALATKMLDLVWYVQEYLSVETGNNYLGWSPRVFGNKRKGKEPFSLDEHRHFGGILYDVRERMIEERVSVRHGRKLDAALRSLGAAIDRLRSRLDSHVCSEHPRLPNSEVCSAYYPGGKPAFEPVAGQGRYYFHGDFRGDGGAVYCARCLRFEDAGHFAYVCDFSETHEAKLARSLGAQRFILRERFYRPDDARNILHEPPPAARYGGRS